MILLFIPGVLTPTLQRLSDALEAVSAKPTPPPAEGAAKEQAQSEPTVPPLDAYFSDFDYFGTGVLKGDFVRGDLALWKLGWRPVWWEATFELYPQPEGLHKAIRRGTALHAANFPVSPQDPGAMGGEFYTLAERNAIYAECLKLGTACVSRSVIDLAQRNDDPMLELANWFYRYAMANVRMSASQTAAVVVEVFQKVADAVSRRPIEDFSYTSFTDFFPLVFNLLVEIASGDPKRLRPAGAQISAHEVSI